MSVNPAALDKGRAMKTTLADLVDQKRIVAIDATPIPAPPNSSHPGDHLFVNCHYDVGMANIPHQELLEEARGDALEIVRILAAQPRIDVVSVVVTVYGHFPSPGAPRLARRRIYRANVLYRDLPIEASLVTADFFSRVAAAESSELDDLAELLHQTAG